MWWEILIGVVITMLLTIIFRYCIFCIYNKECKLKEILKCLCKKLLFIISPDYYLAKYAKEKIKAKYEQKPEKEKSEEEQKEERARYIKTANHANLIISIILCIVTVLLVFLWKCEFVYFLLFGLFGYRLLSRTTEINVAFLKDCVDKDKESNLKKFDRIKLAFFSLIEEAVLFTGIYTFIYDKTQWFKPILSGLHSFILSPVSICSAYRFAVFFKFVAVYQIICSVVLITISFATYISTQDEKK